jgi:hypothetical protein
VTDSNVRLCALEIASLSSRLADMAKRDWVPPLSSRGDRGANGCGGSGTRIWQRPERDYGIMIRPFWAGLKSWSRGEHDGETRSRFHDVKSSML